MEQNKDLELLADELADKMEDIITEETLAELGTDGRGEEPENIGSENE